MFMACCGEVVVVGLLFVVVAEAMGIVIVGGDGGW